MVLHMSVAVITGSAGLVGSEAARFFSSIGMDVVGIDNDMRREFFGDEASTRWNLDRLRQDVPTILRQIFEANAARWAA